MAEEATQVVKAKTRKGQRALDKRAPKMVEDEKSILVLQGTRISQTVKAVLTDISKLKAGHAVKYVRKNEVRPFEPGQEATLQFFCDRSDCSLFCLGSHSKKRPNNIVLGRMYRAQLLDMIELGVTKHVPIQDFEGAAKVAPGAKPCFVFLGDKFETNEDLKLAQSLILDCFHGQVLDEMNLMSLSRVIVCAALSERQFVFRQYAILLKKSGTKIPRVQLEAAGPSLDFEVRRVQHASVDLAKEAMKRPEAGKKKVKNSGFEALHGKVGRIYMPPQNLDNVAIVKSKGVKRARREAAADRKEKHQKLIDSGRDSKVPAER